MYSENLVMLNFFQSVSIWLLTAHWQHPKMDCCPFWASVAPVILTTKQPKTHVAVVKQTKICPNTLPILGGMCSYFTEIYERQNMLKITHLLAFCRHNNSCMNSKHSNIVAVDNEYIIKYHWEHSLHLTHIPWRNPSETPSGLEVVGDFAQIH